MNLDKYEDYDFEELPKDVKTHILKLGYTKEIWDYDDYDWDELPEKIKTAVTNARRFHFFLVSAAVECSCSTTMSGSCWSIRSTLDRRSGA